MMEKATYHMYNVAKSDGFTIYLLKQTEYF